MDEVDPRLELSEEEFVDSVPGHTGSHAVESAPGDRQPEVQRRWHLEHHADRARRRHAESIPVHVVVRINLAGQRPRRDGPCFDAPVVRFVRVGEVPGVRADGVWFRLRVPVEGPVHEQNVCSGGNSRHDFQVLAWRIHSDGDRLPGQEPLVAVEQGQVPLTRVRHVQSDAQISGGRRHDAVIVNVVRGEQKGTERTSERQGRRSGKGVVRFEDVARQHVEGQRVGVRGIVAPRFVERAGDADVVRTGLERELQALVDAVATQVSVADVAHSPGNLYQIVGAVGHGQIEPQVLPARNGELVVVDIARRGDVGHQRHSDANRRRGFDRVVRLECVGGVCLASLDRSHHQDERAGRSPAPIEICHRLQLAERVAGRRLHFEHVRTFLSGTPTGSRGSAPAAPHRARRRSGRTGVGPPTFRQRGGRWPGP